MNPFPNKNPPNLLIVNPFNIEPVHITGNIHSEGGEGPVIRGGS